MADLIAPKQHQGTTARLPGVPRIKAGLAILLIATGLIVGAAYLLPDAPQSKTGALQGATPTEGISAADAYKTLRLTEQAQLTTYGWVDREKGIVRIPIDKAMELILQRGLPVRPPQ